MKDKKYYIKKIVRFLNESRIYLSYHLYTIHSQLILSLFKNFNYL